MFIVFILYNYYYLLSSSETIFISKFVEVETLNAFSSYDFNLALFLAIDWTPSKI